MTYYYIPMEVYGLNDPPETVVIHNIAGSWKDEFTVVLAKTYEEYEEMAYFIQMKKSKLTSFKRVTLGPWTQGPKDHWEHPDEGRIIFTTSEDDIETLLDQIEKFYAYLKKHEIYTVNIKLDTLNARDLAFEIVPTLERFQAEYQMSTIFHANSKSILESILSRDQQQYDDSNSEEEEEPIRKKNYLNQHRLPLLGEDGRYIEALNWEKSGIWKDPNGKEWILPHSRKFPSFIENEYGEFVLTESQFKLSRVTGFIPEPFKYQQFIAKYMSIGSPYRGILLHHGLGSGKSRTTIMVSEDFRRKGLDILFLTPASLKPNFLDEILKWGDDDVRLPLNIEELPIARQRAIRTAKVQQIFNGGKGKGKYHFVSYNAGGGSGSSTKFRKGALGGTHGKGGLMQKLAELGIGHPDKRAPDKYLQNQATKETVERLQKAGVMSPKGLHYPRNMLIIVEEAHDLNSKFSSPGSRVMGQLYPILMGAEDCKIMYLSATPVNNNPFELVTLYNVLRGPIDQEGTTLFPEDEATFIESFINMQGEVPKNLQYFQKRILGLHSNFRGVRKDAKREIYPLRVPKNDADSLEESEMSIYQTLEHDQYLEKELEKERKEKLKRKIFKMTVGSAVGSHAKQTEVSESFEKMSAKKTSSKFRSDSRQACNFVFPPGVIRPRPSVLVEIEADKEPFSFKNIQKEDGTSNYKAFRNKEQYGLISQVLKDATSVHPDDAHKWNIELTRYITSLKELKPIPPGIWELLTPEDTHRFIQSRHQNKNKNQDYALRKADSFEELKRRGKEVFSDEGIKEYGIKIWDIYEKIINDTANGALHIVKGPSEDPRPEAETEFEIPEELNDDSEGEDDDEDNIDPDQHAGGDLPMKGGASQQQEEEQSQEEQSQEEQEEQEEEEKGIPGLPRGPNISTIIPPSETECPLDPQKYLTDDVMGPEYHVEGGPAIVYSFFNTVEGAGITSLFLESRGFQEYRDSNMHTDIDEIPMRPRYAKITGGGSKDPGLHEAIKRVFNHPRNRHGQLIQIIFVTQAAAQGISLFNVRQIHIMEPFWSNIKIRQVMGRGIRLWSHINLPFDQRIVRIWRYHAVRNTDTKSVENRWKNHGLMEVPRTEYSDTTDKYVQKIADRKDKMIFAFNNIADAAAVDCDLNLAVNNDEDNPIECLRIDSEHASAADRSYYTDFKQDFSVSAGHKKVKKLIKKFKLPDGTWGVYYPDDPTRVKVTTRGELFKVYSNLTNVRTNEAIIGYYDGKTKEYFPKKKK